MAVLVQQRKNLILILVKQTQNFAWVCIATMIIVICLLTEKKPTSLNRVMGSSTFWLSFI